MLRHVYLFAALLVIDLSWEGAGQTLYTPGRTPNQPVSQNRYKITGTVVNSATGEPIGRAVVVINGSMSQRVFTDGSGRFEMSDVPEGQIVVNAQRPGFLSREMTGHQSPIITVGPATPPIQVKLIPEGTIRGKVTNNEGEPLENVGVQVMSQQINNGRKNWLPRGGTQTDENGEYQIEDLAPGQYILHTSTYVLSPAASVTENSPVNDTCPPQYFPSASEEDNAQPIDIQAGQMAEADFRLSPVPSYNVSGIVSGPENTNVSCQDANGNPLGSGQIDHRTGRFKLLHVPSGSCTLTFQGQGSQEANFKTYFAEQAITIGSSDLSGIQASAQPLPDIPVHFGDSTGAIPVQLQLMRRQKRGSSQQHYLITQPGQAPAFQNVPPGSYKLIAQNFGNACVNTISQGSTDLLREDLTVVGGSAQAEPIELSLRNDCATLSGTLETNSPGDAGTVLVTSSSPGAEPRIFPFMNGAFSLSGLTPGDYTVYAFTDISGLEYANPEALREFSGQKITLGPGAKTTLQLNLITRGDGQ
ncbi:MAG: collagen binding domain-containing protein [Bryobacteraceae bacterium]